MFDELSELSNELNTCIYFQNFNFAHINRQKQ